MTSPLKAEPKRPGNREQHGFDGEQEAADIALEAAGSDRGRDYAAQMLTRRNLTDTSTN